MTAPADERTEDMDVGNQPLFPPEDAFVVQFQSDSDHRRGRVEHVVSGRSARFDSAEGLFAFIDRISCRRAEAD